MDDRLEAKIVSKARSNDIHRDRGGRRHAPAALLRQKNMLLRQKNITSPSGGVVGFRTGVPALGAEVFGLRGAKTRQTRAVLPGVLRYIGAPPPYISAPGGSA